MMPLIATYRLQMRDGMTFERAGALVPYLKRLGVSHLYLSPVFTAVSGSTHGYDVTDCNAVDPAIGSRQGLDALSAILKQAGLGLIVDIVPNHMAASLENAWWLNVIEWGADSAHARHFDIDWRERLTLPMLGKDFGGILADGELRLEADRGAGRLVLGYFENRFPLAASSYRRLGNANDSPLLKDIASLGADATAENEEAFHAAVAGRLASDAAMEELDGELARLSGDHALIAALHEAQPWRLTFWQDARRHLSYRRFFEVTGLVGMRVEDEAVFADTHRLVLDLVTSGTVDGLRVDHVDGLADPAGYLERLRAAVGPDVPIHVEKILEGHEALPADWPIEGTTGYEFITALGGLMTDEALADPLHAAYEAGLGQPVDLDEERRDAKLLMATNNFAGEFSGLVTSLVTIAGADAPDTDVSREALETALIALILEFPVYRTYGTSDGMPDRDRALLEDVLDAAEAAAPRPDPRALAVIRAALTGEVAREHADTATLFRVKLQQLTGPVMAKAIEDTLFYRFNRLIAVNEVGGDPDDIRMAPDDFHAAMTRRVSEQPLGLLATATHDTKRGEDARARLYAISEAPETWGAAVARWREMTIGRVEIRSGGPAPEPETEWLLFQALAGVWPPELGPDDEEGLAALDERFTAYVEKALREAKTRTSWTGIDADYEASVRAYAAALLDPAEGDFLDDFIRTIVPFIRAGTLTSWAQTVLKMSAPGVPDIYQGSEGRDLSLVDPDNRRPVDFERLAGLIKEDLPGWPATGLLPLGMVKQRIVQRGLEVRARMPEIVTRGAYSPLEVSGPAARHVVAFARGQGEVVAVVPRLTYALVEAGPDPRSEAIWGDTAVLLPERTGGYVDAITGARRDGGPARIADLFSGYPFALLASGD